MRRAEDLTQSSRRGGTEGTESEELCESLLLCAGCCEQPRRRKRRELPRPSLLGELSVVRFGIENAAII